MSSNYSIPESRDNLRKSEEVLNQLLCPKFKCYMSYAMIKLLKF